MNETPRAADGALDGWSETSRTILRDRLFGEAAGGSIPHDEVGALTKSEGEPVDRLMLRLLPIARGLARPPISNYFVGAVALGKSGSLYLGANIEAGANALNQSVHAEQSAISNAFSHGDSGIAAIAVTAAPCGHCRQFMNEISDASSIRIVVEGREPHSLDELLPASFGPRDLGIAGGMFGGTEARLRLTTVDDAMKAALAAAARSYAPHTKARSGCSITTASGRVFAGSYLENAAFNPSLSPMQSAVVAVSLAREPFAAITRVVLVETEGAVISQRSATESVIAAIAPSAALQVFEAKIDGEADAR